MPMAPGKTGKDWLLTMGEQPDHGRLGRRKADGKPAGRLEHDDVTVAQLPHGREPRDPQPTTTAPRKRGRGVVVGNRSLRARRR